MTTTTSVTINTTIVTTVAGTLEVEVDVRGMISQELLVDMFKRGIASAIEVPVEFVVKLEMIEIAQGSRLRRLQSVHTKRYDIAYEVVVPSDMDVDVVLAKANRIAVPDASESHLFRDVLMSTIFVEQVGTIASKIPAFKVGNQASTTAPSTPKDKDKDEMSWKPLLIGAITILLGVSCLVMSAVLISKKMPSTDAGRAGTQSNNGFVRV